MSFLQSTRTGLAPKYVITSAVAVNVMVGMITSSLGFAVFSVSLRWRKETPKFTTVAIAGLVCFLFSSTMIISTESSFLSSGKKFSFEINRNKSRISFLLILFGLSSKI